MLLQRPLTEWQGYKRAKVPERPGLIVRNGLVYFFQLLASPTNCEIRSCLFLSTFGKSNIFAHHSYLRVEGRPGKTRTGSNHGVLPLEGGQESRV